MYNNRILQNLLAKIATTMPRPSTDVDVLNEQVILMRRLIDRGESRRLGRTLDIKLVSVSMVGPRLEAVVQGSSGRYETRITMSPPGHHCMCMDWAQNGKRVGPCKHVLKLAEVWQDQVIQALEAQ